MTWLDHRIPPPAIALALVPVCLGLATLMPRVEVPPTVRIGLTVAIAAAGLGISAAGTIAFQRARTTVNPLHPERASALVTGGGLPRLPAAGAPLAVTRQAQWLAQPCPAGSGMVASRSTPAARSRSSYWAHSACSREPRKYR